MGVGGGGGCALQCNTHCLALQGLCGDGLSRDAACDGSSVRRVAVLWGTGTHFNSSQMT